MVYAFVAILAGSLTQGEHMETNTAASARRRFGSRKFIAWGSIVSAGLIALSVTAAATSFTPHSLGSGGTSSLLISGLTGEGSSNGPGSIEVLSWSWGISQSSTVLSSAGGGAGKVHFHDISFTKKLDKSSPLLALACASGQHFPTVVLTVSPTRTDFPVDTYQIKFTDVFCSTISASGGGGVIPTEQFSINFAKIEWKYLSQDGTAPVKSGWDLKTNTKI